MTDQDQNGTPAPVELRTVRVLVASLSMHFSAAPGSPEIDVKTMAFIPHELVEFAAEALERYAHAIRENKSRLIRPPTKLVGV